MKRILAIMAVAALLPALCRAQVEKEVEVTKAYVPSVESARRLYFNPDRTDTTRMRPEIDYSITPSAYATALEVRPIRPAKVTYWEFNRPKPFYLKVGAGYPLNTVLDFHAATQHPDVGYAVGFVNHYGRFADLRNDAGRRESSDRMRNRIGGAAGRCLGRRLLEGRLIYENRFDRLYGASVAGVPDERLGRRVDYGDAAFDLRFGDDFSDLGRLNFDLAAHASYFYDDSQSAAGLPAPDDRQLDWGGRLRLGRQWGSHTFRFEGGYDALRGMGDLSAYRNEAVRAGLEYRVRASWADLEAGIGYRHVSIRPLEGAARRFDYLLPSLRLRFDTGRAAFVPRIEFDSKVHELSFRTLSRENPWVEPATVLPKNSVDYDLSAGLSGATSSRRFDYDIYVRIRWIENAAYWFLTYADASASGQPLRYGCMQARRNVWTLAAAASWRPVDALTLDVRLRAYRYDDRARVQDSGIGAGKPSFDGRLALDYAHKAFTCGLSVDVAGVRNWSVVVPGADPSVAGRVHVPVTADLGVHVDWHLCPAATLFVEGRNLADARLYEWACYPLMGPHFTAGVKMTF